MSTPSLPSPFPEALAAIAAHLPADSPLARPQWGIICGSGLAGLADTLQERIDVPYSAVPVSAGVRMEGLRMRCRAAHACCSAATAVQRLGRRTAPPLLC
jgi:hypothetical protein